jgi:hypothetical protein
MCIAALSEQMAGQEKMAFSERQVLLRIQFISGSFRSLDVDNCLAAFKMGVDAISEKININDKWFSYYLPRVKYLYRAKTKTEPVFYGESSVEVSLKIYEDAALMPDLL